MYRSRIDHTYLKTISNMMSLNMFKLKIFCNLLSKQNSLLLIQTFTIISSENNTRIL
jgi:hypothetical protein